MRFKFSCALGLVAIGACGGPPTEPPDANLFDEEGGTAPASSRARGGASAAQGGNCGNGCARGGTASAQGGARSVNGNSGGAGNGVSGDSNTAASGSSAALGGRIGSGAETTGGKASATGGTGAAGKNAGAGTDGKTPAAGGKTSTPASSGGAASGAQAGLSGAGSSGSSESSGGDAPAGGGSGGNSMNGSSGASGASNSSVGGADGGSNDDNPPFFSEYVEGTSSYKALEIVAVAPRALAGCQIEIYANGASTNDNGVIRPKRSRVIELTGEVSWAAPFVVCTPELAALVGGCSRTETLTFTGNDAVLLVCGGKLADAFGRLLEDPGPSGWGAPAARTADVTLRRSCSVLRGDTVADDAFEPSAEWLAQPVDSFDGLGSHCSEP